MSRAGMRCPVCGGEMNLHADKLVHPVTPEEEKLMTPALDGVIEEVFACPGCGRIESRRPTGTRDRG